MSGIVLKHQISGYGHRSFAVMEKQRKRFDSGGFSDQLSPAGVAACSDPSLNFLLVEGRLWPFLLGLWMMAGFCERADLSANRLCFLARAQGLSAFLWFLISWKDRIRNLREATVQTSV